MPNSPLEKYTVHSGTCHQGSLPEIFRNAKIAQRTMGLRQIKDSPWMLPRLEGWIVGMCCYIATGMFEILYLGNIPKLAAAICTCFKSHICKTPQKPKHLYPIFKWPIAGTARMCQAKQSLEFELKRWNPLKTKFAFNTPAHPFLFFAFSNLLPLSQPSYFDLGGCIAKSIVMNFRGTAHDRLAETTVGLARPPE